MLLVKLCIPVLFLGGGSNVFFGFLERSVTHQRLRTAARMHSSGLNRQVDRSTPGLEQGPEKPGAL